MKIALAQINYHIGNFESNIQKIKDAIGKAKKEQVDLIVFAELAVCGYPPRDFLEFNDFINKCSLAIKEIASECNSIAAIVGSPSVNPKIEGKDLFNTAFFLADGKIKSQHSKALLPNYDIFDEYRYFEPNRNFNTIEYMGKRLAITICEDLWDIGDDPLYTISPMDELMKSNPDILINIAASPFNCNQAQTRKEILKENAKKYKLPLYYVNHVGAQTELLFDGGSLVINSTGEIVDELNYFMEDFRIYENDNLKFKLKEYQTEPIKKKYDKISLIHDALIMGITNYFKKLGFQKAILGLSGGIDSAVTLVLAAKALGNENVRPILLPSRYSSDHSLNDAVLLAQNLDVSYEIISIEEAFRSFEVSLHPYFKDTKPDITEENIQARIRAIILMALSNKYGYILLNTSNKSEAAVGYGTLYGDMCGGISVLGDVYKTDVFSLANYINKEKEIIPLHTIKKAPSAELRADQKDSDSLPDYEILDQILYQYIELRKGPNELIQAGFDSNIVRKVLKLVNTNEYKRFQTPPILRISSKAFGMGRRMPIVGKYLS
ncbi:NAD+ synthase [Bacteroidota bacterium]